MHLVIIKDLVRVLQNGINNLCLQAQVSKSISTKQRGTQDDGQVVRVHAVEALILNDAVHVQSQRPESGVVWIR